MDDLEFRRRLYADPQDTDTQLEQCAAQDPEKRALQSELKELDKSLHQALNIDVPEGLSEKLILQQSLVEFKQRKRRTRTHLALAASIAFAFGVSFTLYQQPGPINMEQHALAHIYHELGSLEKSTRDINLTKVNTKLASFGGQFNELPSTVTYAKYCDFNGQKSMHLVLQTDTGPMTVFIVPAKNQFTTDSYFSDQRFDGAIYQSEKANLIILGDKGSDLEQQKQRVEETLQWRT